MMVASMVNQRPPARVRLAPEYFADENRVISTSAGGYSLDLAVSDTPLEEFAVARAPNPRQIVKPIAPGRLRVESPRKGRLCS